MNGIPRGLLTITVPPLLLLAACDEQEYDDYDRPIEKTDVRVVGVDLGNAVDASEHITGHTDLFAANDTIYASVQTKGASSKTVLGVRWKDPDGSDIGSSNVVIRPTGKASTLFRFTYLANRSPGFYSLDVRVNGKTVRTLDFNVGESTAPRRTAQSEPVEEQPGVSVEEQAGEPAEEQPAESRADTRPFITRAYDKVKDAAAGLFDRASGDQSPFEWRGLRAGMQFSRLNRLTEPGSPWKCTPFFLSAVGVERGVARESHDFSAGRVIAMVDTVDHRVFNVSYSVIWMPPDTSGRVAFQRELTALANKWNNMSGLIRQPARQVESGPSSSKWVTPDSAWSARISYTTSHGRTRPDGLEIEEIQWGHRLEAEIPDSIKGQMHNPESPYYRNQKPGGGCEALLKAP